MARSIFRTEFDRILLFAYYLIISSSPRIGKFSLYTTHRHRDRRTHTLRFLGETIAKPVVRVKEIFLSQARTTIITPEITGSWLGTDFGDHGSARATSGRSTRNALEAKRLRNLVCLCGKPVLVLAELVKQVKGLYMYVQTQHTHTHTHTRDTYTYVNVHKSWKIDMSLTCCGPVK